MSKTLKYARPATSRFLCQILKKHLSTLLHSMHPCILPALDKNGTTMTLFAGAYEINLSSSSLFETMNDSWLLF